MTVEEIVTERRNSRPRCSTAPRPRWRRSADRRLAADPVDRRPGHGIHRRDGDAAQRRDPAPGEDRAGAGQPGCGRSRAAVPAQAGRVRAPDRDRSGAVQGRGRQGSGGGGQAGPLAQARPSAR